MHDQETEDQLCEDSTEINKIAINEVIHRNTTITYSSAASLSITTLIFTSQAGYRIIGGVRAPMTLRTLCTGG